jgi:hypothetical protein
LELRGLGIPHLDETIRGLKQNPIQKMYKKGLTNQTANQPYILLGLRDRQADPLWLGISYALGHNNGNTREIG